MFKLDSFQTAIFVNNINLNDKLKIASDIVSINKGIFNLKDEKEQFLDIICDEYLDILLSIASFLKENYIISINRIGFVSNLSLVLNESSNDYIIHKYMKGGGLISGTSDLQIHALNKINLADEIKANRWLRIITTKSVSQPDNDKCLVILIDINSDPDIPRNFDIELIRKFFSSTIDHIKNLMEQHYEEN
jgi:hypothetical protein